ncbi:MAG: caspase family protein [Gemmatimonadaceae bacterium]|nr:caspase family protein [Gemmatimonadaceae bacterium]
MIGIDHYRNGIPALRTAVNDARRLGEVLASEHGYDIVSLLDEEATQARITAVLTQELPARLGPDDRVLFYFAGHGVARDGDEGPNGYLLPIDASRADDATFLDMPLVHDALLALPCRHMLVILDSCFSGAFRWSGVRDVDEEPGVVHQEKYERYVRDPAWQVITSASQDQKALDQLSSGALGSRPGDGAHSPFALALFDALHGAGDLVPRGTGDGLVTATELYLYVGEALQSAAIAAGREQTPRLWPLRKHDRGEFVFFVPGRDLALPPAPPLTFESNPWRGLGSYESADAPLFFGRGAEIASLTERIAAQSLTVVLGASGSGKSSLVKAGVVPALAAAGWQVAPIVRPGTAPLTALATALAPPGRSVQGATAETITALVAARFKAQPASRLLLVIDQFEELITLARRAGERERIIALLARLIAAHPGQLRVVITLRTDFEPNFDRAGLGEHWQQGRYVVPLMSRSSLRDVIEKPAEARVLYFDPSSLVETLLDEVVATPGPLPLLSFALSEMYIRYVQRKSSDRAITRADFDAVGGVVGALRSRAEAEHDSLDETARGTLRRVLLRLVTAEGTGIARRRASDAELAFADTAEQQRASAIVQRLVEARLLVQGREPDGERFVEPAHDALVRGWGRLAEWVRRENDAIFPLSQQQRLSRAAQDWQRAEGAGKRGLLWSDASRSAQLAPLVRRRAPWLNVTELAFAQRSVRGRRVALAGAAAAVLAIVVAGVVAVIGGRRASARAEQVRIASIVRSATALVNEDPLVATQLLGSIDSSMVRSADDATRLAILGAALELRRVPRVVATFENEAGIADAVVSADGQSLATAAKDGVVRVWPLSGGGAPLSLPRAADTVQVLQFSPDARQVAVGEANGRVTVWPLQPRGAPVALIGGTRGVQRLEFSADGRRLLVTYDSTNARVFAVDGSVPPSVIGTASEVVDLARWVDGDRQVVVINGDRAVEWWPSSGGAAPARTVRVAGDAIVALDVSRTGGTVALGTARGRMQVHDAVRGRLLRTFTPHGDAVFSLSLSSDGTQLASASADEEVRIMDVASGETQSRLRGTSDPVQSAAFARDGQRLILTSGTTFQARVWSGREGDALVPLAGHTNALVSELFMPRSDRVLTASEDGSVRLWELPVPRLYVAASAVGDTLDDVGAAGFSRDGRQLALGTRRGEISVVRLDDTARVRRVVDSANADLCALAFAPGDTEIDALRCDAEPVTSRLAGGTRRTSRAAAARRVVAADFAPRARRGLWLRDSAEVHVWDATSPARARVVRQASDRERRCAALSDDGERVAVCAVGGGIELASFVTGGAPVRIASRGTPTALAFNRAGTMLAIGHLDGSARLVSLTKADTGRVLLGQREPITRLEYSADDARLLTVSEDGSVMAWDAASATSLVRLRPRGIEVRSAHFTADGRRIVTLGFNQGEARLWNADGSGGSVALPGDGTLVTQALPSPDGRWVLTTTAGQTAELYPTDPEVALGPLRRSPVCLSASDRVRYLTERPRVAERRAGECRSSRRP